CRARTGRSQGDRRAADHGGEWEKGLSLGRMPFDSGRENRLLRRGNLDRLDLSSQPIVSWLADQRLRFHEGPDGLLQEGGVPAADQQLLERDEPGIIAEQGAE